MHYYCHITVVLYQEVTFEVILIDLFLGRHRSSIRI